MMTILGLLVLAPVALMLGGLIALLIFDLIWEFVSAR